MKRWSRYSWRSDETKLVSAILDAARESEASKVASEVDSSDGVVPENPARNAKELHSPQASAG